ncbi:hypothetical protein, partial [Clostridium perfringens]|uniref:hypothetical protein n=1 Tax=Clostridium perfringens TaxID=1502 RepID=UPI002ACD42E1
YKLIDEMIYDGKDDYKSNAIVNYDPVLGQYNMQAPIVEEPPLKLPVIDESVTNKLKGVIRENMVLTKDNSPYEIDKKVQVADGVTITVEPGVTLQNGYIEIFGSGKLIVNGQANENAVLNNVIIDADNWSNATVIINNATLNKVKYDSFVSGKLSIVESKLYGTYINLYEPREDCVIERNLFTENSTINLTSTNNNTLIKDNTFKNETKTSDINYNYTNQKTQKIKIEGNNFLVVDKIVLKIENVGAGDIID